MCLLNLSLVPLASLESSLICFMTYNLIMRDVWPIRTIKSFNLSRITRSFLCLFEYDLHKKRGKEKKGGHVD